MLTRENLIFSVAAILGVLVGLAYLGNDVNRELRHRDAQITTLQREVNNLTGQLHDTVQTMHYLTDPDTIQERTINRLLGRE